MLNREFRAFQLSVNARIATSWIKPNHWCFRCERAHNFCFSLVSRIHSSNSKFCHQFILLILWLGYYSNRIVSFFMLLSRISLSFFFVAIYCERIVNRIIRFVRKTETRNGHQVLEHNNIKICEKRKKTRQNIHTLAQRNEQKKYPSETKREKRVESMICMRHDECLRLILTSFQARLSTVVWLAMHHINNFLHCKFKYCLFKYKSCDCRECICHKPIRTRSESKTRQTSYIYEMRATEKGRGWQCTRDQKRKRERDSEKRR